MILGGEGHNIVDHSGQDERLTLSLDSIEEGSVKLVVATDAGEEIGEALDLVEELWLRLRHYTIPIGPPRACLQGCP